MKPGVYETRQKNGTVVYRSSVTMKGKHISLGTFRTESEAHGAYLDALRIIEGTGSPEDHGMLKVLPFDKQISLMNFRDNDLYFSNPIYLCRNYFFYYYSPEEIFTFDRDDLFFFAGHRIQKRGGRLFVSDYGMQITLKSRYGIRNYAVHGRDYVHLNGDQRDFRYENIRILSSYSGVIPISDRTGRQNLKYKAVIHIKGNWVIGTYDDEATAAIAYNKAADFLKKCGISRNYPQNYIDSLPASRYASIYSQLCLQDFEQKITEKQNVKKTGI